MRHNHVNSQVLHNTHSKWVYGWLMVFTLCVLFLVQSTVRAAVLAADEDQHNKQQSLANIGHSKDYLDEQFRIALQAYHTEDYVLSFRMFRLLAGYGHTKSEYYVGVHYDMGAGVEKNLQKASQWYTRAAVKGNDRAQHNLAVAYARGEGVASNIQVALRWWLKSARQGNTDSAYNLGILYAMGHKGLAPDHDKAMHWWRKAAKKGDAYAQFNLGTMYANGGVGIRDYCAAIHWWQLSAENGVTEAREAMQMIRQRNEYKSCTNGKGLNVSEKNNDL